MEMATKPGKASAEDEAEPWSDKIKRARAERGLSQRALAEKAGVSHITIARIETGKHDPQGETLQKILKALKDTPKLPEV